MKLLQNINNTLKQNENIIFHIKANHNCEKANKTASDK